MTVRESERLDDLGRLRAVVSDVVAAAPDCGSIAVTRPARRRWSLETAQDVSIERNTPVD